MAHFAGLVTEFLRIILNGEMEGFEKGKIDFDKRIEKLEKEQTDLKREIKNFTTSFSPDDDVSLRPLGDDICDDGLNQTTKQ